MKWPWVSRKKYDEVMANALKLANMVESYAATSDHYERALGIANALRRDEQWRRLKAEGQLAYVQDRVVRARDMMLTYVEEPPTMKRKAIPE